MNPENVVADRKIHFAPKESEELADLVIQIGKPYWKEESGYAVCNVEWTGLQRSYEVAGADLLQALQLAVDVEAMLLKLSEEYDLYFPDGEPYFD